MRKNLINILKISVILFFISILILSNIISQDAHHLEFCEHEHCFKCAIIHIAKTIINITKIICHYAFIGFLIYFFLSNIHVEEDEHIQSSLVFQKVQFNE